MRLAPLVWVAIGLSIGCTSESTDTTDDSDRTGETDSDDTDPDTDDSDTDDSDTDTDDRVPARPQGVIAGPDGEVVRTRVNVCLGACYTTASDPETGRYAYDFDIEPDRYWFYVVPVGEYPDTVATSFPIDLGDDPAPTFDVSVPASPGWVDLPAAAAPLDLGDGIELTAGLNTLSVPDGRTRVTAAWGDPAELALKPGDGQQVLAVVYLNPYDAKAADGQVLPLTLENRWGGADGSTVEVYAGQYDWVRLGEFTVEDGRVSIPNVGVLASVAVVGL